MRHPDAGFVAGLDREQRLRYYGWWCKYILLGRASWGFGATSLLCWVLLVFPTPVLPIVRAVWLPAVLAFLFFGLWSALLDCPRCGEKFRGWFAGGESEYLADECQNCGLTKAQLSAVAKPRD